MVHTFSLMDYDVFIIAIIILTYSYCVSMLYGCGNSLWISSSWILWMIHGYYACYGYYGRHGYCLTFIDMGHMCLCHSLPPKKNQDIFFQVSLLERWKMLTSCLAGCSSTLGTGMLRFILAWQDQFPQAPRYPKVQTLHHFHSSKGTLNAWEATTSPYTCSSEHGNCSTEKFYVDFCQ